MRMRDAPNFEDFTVITYRKSIINSTYFTVLYKSHSPLSASSLGFRASHLANNERKTRSQPSPSRIDLPHPDPRPRKRQRKTIWSSSCSS